MLQTEGGMWPKWAGEAGARDLCQLYSVTARVGLAF